MHDRITIPKPLRKLRAKAFEKGMRLIDVAQAAGVPYKTTSQILAGRLIRPSQLHQIETAIEAAQEVA